MTTPLVPVESNSAEIQKLHGATFEGDIEALLDQIGQGLRLDDATNLEKLTIARQYGPLLLQLKAIVPHGHFKAVLKERFPRISYSKCNRWMIIAQREVEVADALAAYPHVAWGPKKMIDFLAQEWRPDSDADEDEEDCWGIPAEDATPTTDHNAETIQSDAIVDDEATPDAGDDFNDRSRWEELAAKAESEARLIGNEPVDSSSDGVVSVTVFSVDDHEAIHACLAPWQPKSIPLFGRKGASSLTATVGPKEVPDVLLTLAETLKKSQPSQLKLSIEL